MCVIALGRLVERWTLKSIATQFDKPLVLLWTEFSYPYYRLTVKLILAYNFMHERLPFGRKN